MPGRILIADATPCHRIALKARLGKASYRLFQAADAPQAAEMALKLQPQLVIADAGLPGGGAVALCTAMQTQPATRAIPVLAITETGDAAARCAALGAGAQDVIQSTLPESVLLARVRSLIRRHAESREVTGPQDTAAELGFAEAPATWFRPPGRVGLIAADRARAETWRGALAPVRADSLQVFSPTEALALGSGRPAPDVFVLAAETGQPGDGLDLVAELRSRSATRHASLVLLHPPGASGIETRALDLGAEDVLEEPFDPRELSLRVMAGIARKQERDRRLRTLGDGLRMAALDPLTGLLNRRAAETRLARIAATAAETGTPFAALALDLDRFKRINDTHGHHAGDTVLREVAGRLGALLRESSLIARTGGEEFLVVLPEAEPAAARHAGARLLAALRERPVALPGGAVETVTASCGVAVGGTRGETTQSVIERADAALYRAKAGGRDRLEVAPAGMRPRPGAAAIPYRPHSGPSRRERLAAPLRAEGTGTGWPPVGHPGQGPERA